MTMSQGSVTTRVSKAYKICRPQLDPSSNLWSCALGPLDAACVVSKNSLTFPRCGLIDVTVSHDVNFLQFPSAVKVLFKELCKGTSDP